MSNGFMTLAFSYRLRNNSGNKMIHNQLIPPPVRSFFALKKFKKDSKMTGNRFRKPYLKKVSLQRNGYRKMAKICRNFQFLE